MSWEVIVGGVVAIVAGLVGWLSNELSTWIRLKREDRAAIGQLLAFLAGMRYQLTAMPLYLRTAQEKYPLNLHEVRMIRDFIDATMSDPEDAEALYNQAVHLIAGRRPDLAVEMQRKNRLPDFLREWRSLVMRDPFAEPHMEKMEECLHKIILPELDKTIKSLAWKHGALTWFRFRSSIQGWNDTDFMRGEVEKWLDNMLQCIGEDVNQQSTSA